MPAIKKILFPVDFSTRCLEASPYVEEMAGWFQAQLLLLHVVQPGTDTLAEELKPQRQAELDAFLAAELKQFNTERICVTGDPAEKIAEFAHTWRPDLVMMPTHGVGFFRSLLLGSVTAKVLNDVACPVWTGVHSGGARPLEIIKCENVLCAIDFGARSREVLEWAAFFAREHQARLTLLHAVPKADAAAATRALEAEFVAALTEDAQAKIAALQAAAGTNAEVRIAGGSPGSAVKQLAGDLAADLLIVGRHSGTGLPGYLRHNAYALIRESPCPVISV